MERAFEEKGVFEEKVGGLRGEVLGTLSRRSWVFEEKAGGRKRRLQPLREYIIILYTN
ncbi:hypothetical protein Tco_0376658, partial [Tanacetum coccineum]